MNVKKAGIIATITAGVVLAGGGAWAATAIASDEPEPVAVSTPTSTPTPEATATPEATPTPTPEATYSEAEAELIQVTRYGDLSNLDLSDAEILTAAQQVCAERDAGLSGESLTTTVPGATDAQNVQFRINAVGSVCVAQD